MHAIPCQYHDLIRCPDPTDKHFHRFIIPKAQTCPFFIHIPILYEGRFSFGWRWRMMMLIWLSLSGSQLFPLFPLSLARTRMLSFPFGISGTGSPRKMCKWISILGIYGTDMIRDRVTVSRAEDPEPGLVSIRLDFTFHTGMGYSILIVILMLPGCDAEIAHQRQQLITTPANAIPECHFMWKRWDETSK